MKLKIKIAFTDKYNGDVYNKGDEIEFAEERAKELLADKRGLVEVAEETKPKKATKKK